MPTVNLTTQKTTASLNDSTQNYKVTGSTKADKVLISPEVNVSSMDLKAGNDAVHLPYDLSEYTAKVSKTTLILTASDNSVVKMNIGSNEKDILYFADGFVNVKNTRSNIYIGNLILQANKTYDLINQKSIKLNTSKSSETKERKVDIISNLSLSVDQASKTEGSSFYYTLSLDKANTQPLTVNYAVSNISTDDNDFTGSTSGSVTFNAGEISKSISISSKQDSDVEADQSFSLNLSKSSNLLSLNKSSIVNTILNDDQQKINTNFTEITQTEGQYIFSAQGRYVSFESYPSLFVKDVQTGTIKLVSAASDGTQGNGPSYYPSMSWDGRYVAFWSEASNLVEDYTYDTNEILVNDIFVKDVQTGTIKLVSAASDGTRGNDRSEESFPSISSDGRYVVFGSKASNLVVGDTNNDYDIFVKDVQTGAIKLVSAASDGTQGNNSSSSPSVSSNGRYVAFQSLASNLVVGDTNNKMDIFVKDVQTGTIKLVSTAIDGTQGNNFSWTSWRSSSVSSDGRYVVFESNASNLVTGDTNGTTDVFVKDMQTGAIKLVSTGNDGTQGNASSRSPSMSSDGRYVAFESNASNLVTGDANGEVDIFVKDVQTGAIKLVSIASDGTQGNASSSPSVSSNGRYISFYSDANNLTAEKSSGSFVTPNPVWQPASMQKQQPLNLSLEIESPPFFKGGNVDNVDKGGFNAQSLNNVIVNSEKSSPNPSFKKEGNDDALALTGELINLNPNQFNLNNMTSSLLNTESILSNLNNNILAG